MSECHTHTWERKHHIISWAIWRIRARDRQLLTVRTTTKNRREKKQVHEANANDNCFTASWAYVFLSRSFFWALFCDFAMIVNQVWFVALRCSVCVAHKSAINELSLFRISARVFIWSKCCIHTLDGCYCWYATHTHTLLFCSFSPKRLWMLLFVCCESPKISLSFHHPESAKTIFTFFFFVIMIGFMCVKPKIIISHCSTWWNGISSTYRPDK